MSVLRFPGGYLLVEDELGKVSPTDWGIPQPVRELSPMDWGIPQPVRELSPTDWGIPQPVRELSPMDWGIPQPVRELLPTARRFDFSTERAYHSLVFQNN